MKLAEMAGRVGKVESFGCRPDHYGRCFKVQRFRAVVHNPGCGAAMAGNGFKIEEKAGE